MPREASLLYNGYQKSLCLTSNEGFSFLATLEKEEAEKPAMALSKQQKYLKAGTVSKAFSCTIFFVLTIGQR